MLTNKALLHFMTVIPGGWCYNSTIYLTCLSETLVSIVGRILNRAKIIAVSYCSLLVRARDQHLANVGQNGHHYFCFSKLYSTYFN